jgi:hypothetical protein
VHYFLGIVLLARGEPQSALAEMAKDTQEPTRLGGSAIANFALGRKEPQRSAKIRQRRVEMTIQLADIWVYVTMWRNEARK